MKSFLDEVAEQCLQLKVRPEDMIFVLPSKRAGSFLKSRLAEKLRKTVIAPKFYGVEAFAEQVSGLEYASQTELHFELYQAYLETNPKQPESFYNFCKWGQTLLQDFNEIDRYLIDPARLFSYLADVKEMEHWMVTSEKTPLMEGYIRFWNSLEPIYRSLHRKLHEKNLGYQGMIYRTACSRLGEYMQATAAQTHIFVGFNALNTAESQIIQQLMDAGKAICFWDIDKQFLDDPVHDAGLFIRQYLARWKSLAGSPLPGLTSAFASPKNIEVAAVPKNISQVHYVGQLLSQIHAADPKGLDQTAVVLGDERLLNPLLHAIPKEIGAVNITMGYPLQNSPLAGLFSRYFELYLHQGPHGWFYSQVLSLLAHPYLEPLLTSGGSEFPREVTSTIREKNWIYFNWKKLSAIPGTPPDIFRILFIQQTMTPERFITCSLKLILALKEHFQQEARALILEELYRFYMLFNQLEDYIARYPFIQDLRTLQSLYHSLLSAENIDFRGEPMEGLQVMGMLESRNLDFETVILTSVNEGILPAGKNSTSIIPFDLKREFGLPTFKEKDAVYSYHFYRLLQRAKNIYLIYNSEPDVLEGGEKSRLITQLLTDRSLSASVKQVVASPALSPHVMAPIAIEKDEGIMNKLGEKAMHGFSPTSLTTYIRNPIDFYTKSILGIDEAQEVDESIAATTFGTVVHAALEDLYHPFIGRVLTTEMLTKIRTQIRGVVRAQLTKVYSQADQGIGKNLIAFEVLVRYVERLIDLEEQSIQVHTIEILALEKELKTGVDIRGLDLPFNLRGVIDRVDRCDGKLRIIDYKTGHVIPRNVEIYDWQELIEKEDFGKAFQLLCYALMYRAEAGDLPLEAGIISLKNLGMGFMPFALKEAGKRTGKQQVISREVLDLFRQSLERLVLEIFDPKVPFVEKTP